MNFNLLIANRPITLKTNRMVSSNRLKPCPFFEGNFYFNLSLYVSEPGEREGLHLDIGHPLVSLIMGILKNGVLNLLDDFI